MRESMVQTLMTKQVDFIRYDEMLSATPDEIREAIKRLEGKPRTKHRIKSFEKELEIREGDRRCPLQTEEEKREFTERWNEVIKMFK